MPPLHVALILFVSLAIWPRTASAENPAELDAWRGVVQATEEYRASLERLLVFQERDVARAAELVERRREFVARGIVARRDLEESERARAHARATVEDTRRQIVTAETVIAEAAAREQLAAHPPARGEPVALDRDAGSVAWSLAEAARVQRFFARQFGRPLPVSAWGQTVVHSRLGFDHRNALDVAVHPDSPEGEALMAFLRGAGIPFVAVRSVVPGRATGAHIHVGPESPRRTPN